MNRFGTIAAAAVILCTLTACAAGSAASHQAAGAGIVSQLVLGLWHGIIAPVTLIVEVIRKLAPGVLPWLFKLYETANTSVAYDVGFYFGLAGGPTFVWSRARR